jgi:hypothetical protein
MLLIGATLPVCHNCPGGFREDGAGANKRCLANGRKYATNAKQGRCPKFYFPPANVLSPLRAADAAARRRRREGRPPAPAPAMPPPAAIPSDFNPADEQRRLRGSCCSPPPKD